MISFSTPNMGAGNDALMISFIGADGAEYAYKTVATTVSDGDGVVFDLLGNKVAPEAFVNIGVEYNPTLGTVKYYVNGILAATETVETTETAMARVRIYTTGIARNYVLFDNLYFGCVKKHLAESDEYYTFNDGKVPADVTLTQKSQGATLTVGDAPCLNTTEKALMLDTNKGGDDQVYFKVKGDENATKFIFETKYFIDITESSNQVYWLMDKDNRAVGYIMVSMGKDGSITVADYISYNGSAGTGYFSNTTIRGNGKPQWIDIKLVGYEDENSKFCMEIYVNGEYINTSRHSHWLETTVDRIAYVRFYAYSALDATVYFDDVKAEKIAE
jgi:hypothetical protein